MHLSDTREDTRRERRDDDNCFETFCSNSRGLRIKRLCGLTENLQDKHLWKPLAYVIILPISFHYVDRASWTYVE